jgi:methylthioribose-1-phosphate isomerase
LYALLDYYDIKIIVMNTKINAIKAVEWKGKGVSLLDQRQLPEKETYLHLHTCAEVASAINNMTVRGAPAIGITAAYGVVLAAHEAYKTSSGNWREKIMPSLEELASSRPTAVNLRWAIHRMSVCFEDIQGDPMEALLEEAVKIHQEDIQANHVMADIGASYLDGTKGILTHCNAGALATGGHGTALGVIRNAMQRDATRVIYACETRPWLQGARLTAWELSKENIPVKLLADSAASSLMQGGYIDWVIVGADRITANGDVINKIGTYSHALGARYHGLKFMVVAPCSTIDMDTAEGSHVAIELRDQDDFFSFSYDKMQEKNIQVINPVFDVTPAKLVDIIITEKGAIEAPNKEKIHTLMQS